MGVEENRHLQEHLHRKDLSLDANKKKRMSRSGSSNKQADKSFQGRNRGGKVLLILKQLEVIMLIMEERRKKTGRRMTTRNMGAKHVLVAMVGVVKDLTTYLEAIQSAKVEK
ncbi:unnamed protein product [Albugo candida]|uniref:Uncharacterized protein n=1 Tax=Albugo candida TaxID=65357 RepID=A0A024FWL9_9STRA|nr:unnamed protein product [Albugo candida]|eukprot:CCI11568.1 unnamed protein product [Albugo candida]